MNIHILISILIFIFQNVYGYDNLTNPNSTSSTKLLYNYLVNNFGKKIISGQVGSAGYLETEEFDYIKKITGKTPAMFNVDFIFESLDHDWKPDDSIADMVLAWWKKYEGKGILHAQWHWNKKGSDGQVSFYTKNVDFDITKALIEGTNEYKSIMADMDYIASQIKILQDKDIPIIWRPLHEASGGWFWWGAKGPEPCVALYKMMYERFTKVHKLNNLIWCWNGGIGNWYPGDEYVDIISEDVYDKHSSFASKYNSLLNQVGNKKIIALSENGSLPDIESCMKERITWSFFCTWNNEYILNNSDNIYNTPEYIKSVYNSNYVITQSDLPSFATKSLDYEVKTVSNGFPTCKSCDVTATGTDGVSLWGWENEKSCKIDKDRCFNLNNKLINNNVSTLNGTMESTGINNSTNMMFTVLLLLLLLIFNQ